jgi:thiol-disulfide isomerase/thioredoxin
MEQIVILNLIVLWGVVLLLLWLLLRLAQRPSVPSQARPASSLPARVQAEPLLGQPAPAFVAWTLDHERVTQTNYLGTNHEVLFIFLSTTCPHCRNVLPEIERVGEKLRQRGGSIAFVFGEAEEKVRVYVESIGLDLPILIAPRELSSFTSDYNRRAGVPAFVAVNPAGIVTHEGVVNPREEAWRMLIQEWHIYPTLTKAAALYRL